MNLPEIQAALRDGHHEAWLFYDHHHRDPIAYRVLGLPPDRLTTRRWFYLIPADGEPVKLVHRIESHHLDSLPGRKLEYSAWEELWANLESMVKPYRKVVMQYSPNNQIPYISLVDAGMLDLMRSFGKEIETSANLVARFEATLTDAQIATHYKAQAKVDADHRWRISGDRPPRPQRRHQRIRNSAVDHGSLPPRGPHHLRSAQRQRERQQRRPALRALGRNFRADQAGRFRPARHLGQVQ